MSSLVTCPFDKSHMILESRIQFHIVRCQKNHSKSTKVTCPYNAVHIVEAIHLQSHLAECANAKEVQSFNLQLAEKEVPGIITMEEVLQVADKRMMGHENWDNDAQCFSYNGFEQCANRDVVRTLIGASKAKRREFREQERARMAKLASGQPQLRTPRVRSTERKSEISTPRLKVPDNKAQESSGTVKSTAPPRAQEQVKPAQGNVIEEAENKMQEMEKQERATLAKLGLAARPREKSLVQLRTPHVTSTLKKDEMSAPRLKARSEKAEESPATAKSTTPPITQEKEKSEEENFIEESEDDMQVIEEQLKQLELKRKLLEAKKKEKLNLKKSKELETHVAAAVETAIEYPKIGRCAANFSAVRNPAGRGQPRAPNRTSLLGRR